MIIPRKYLDGELRRKVAHVERMLPYRVQSVRRCYRPSGRCEVQLVTFRNQYGETESQFLTVLDSEAAAVNFACWSPFETRIDERDRQLAEL